MRAAALLVLAGPSLAACDDAALRAFEPIASAMGGAAGAPVGDTGGGGTSGMPAVAGTGPILPSLPFVIDDFEDVDTRAKLPLGWWYPINDGRGTQGWGIEPTDTGTASIYTLRTFGSDFVEWGAAVGVNLIGDAMPLTLPSQGQLCVTARIGPGSSQTIQAHLLQNEDRHFVQELSLTESFNRYCFPLTSFVDRDGVELVPEKLTALQFFFQPGVPFLVWLDDIEVIP